MPQILNKYYPPTKLFFVFGEAVCIVCSILLAMSVRFGDNFDVMALNIQVWGKILLMASICQLCLYYNNLYDLRITETYVELGLRLMQSLGISSILLAVIYYAFPSAMLGRGVFLISIIFLVIFVCSWRYFYSWILKKKMFTERIMILGRGKLAMEIINEINCRPDSGYQISGIITMNPTSPSAFCQGIPHFRMNKTLYELAESLHTKEIVVAVDQKRGKLPINELLRCRMQGINIIEGATLYEKLTGKIFVEKLKPSWLIFSDGFRKSRATRFTKRAVGLVGASVGLLLTLPLMGLIALAIKLDSKGPVMFRQERCGEGGRVFELCKFRSMIDNAEAVCGPCWASDDDQRITRVGGILRKYRLDEIPQMWNVLKGNMSFVGPRPERPEFVKRLNEIIPYYPERFTIKPGITGWAQVCYHYGGSIEDAIEKLQYELFYVKNMNLLFDMAIIFQTIKIVMSGRGAR